MQKIKEIMKVIQPLLCRVVLPLAAILVMPGCKKFLTVEPIDRLSDATFWHTAQDVESAVSDVYGSIFDRIATGPYHLANGDMRAGDISWEGNHVRCFEAVGENDLNNTTRMNDPDRYMMTALSDWYPFYQSIASCNIDIQRIPTITALTDSQIKAYLAEVRFIRAFTYFYISRIYGDVPLYTEPYDKTARARTPMAEVMDFCLKECMAIKGDLPWQYEDPAKWGVRAARGAVCALIANIHMWMAGFDKSHQQQHWQGALDAVNEIKSSGNFELLPIDQFHLLFKGRTKESLFEFSVNANYGGATKYVTAGEWMTHTPVINYDYSWSWYKSDYMQKIFPPTEEDKRKDLWFYLPYANNDQTMFMKFSNVSDPDNWFFDDNLMIFRYGGVLLLGAEAAADLNQNSQATTLLNLVRKRAGAVPYAQGEGDLKTFVFRERQRELIGEGVRWYDLIRTGRVTDPNECTNTLTEDQFNRGGWTWPIDPKARVNNPKIQLNGYWTK